MKPIIVTALTVLMTFVSFASIEKRTYFFRENSVRFTETSLDELLLFKFNTMRQGVKFVEIKIFSEQKESSLASQELSESRLDYILNLLVLKQKPITIYLHKSDQTNENYNPGNWNRVDIYYKVEKTCPIQPKKMNGQDLFTSNKDETLNPVCSKDASSESKSSPFVLPILFEGGTSTVTEETMIYLHNLRDTLQHHPELNAHLRGHVCCGNKMSISRKRAKAVYNYLIKNGIKNDRITYKGYSNTIPLVYPERTSEDRSANRRVDVIFYFEQDELNKALISDLR
jgi:outer membrane protein OmpA-like peptidoglycan-associated protein